MRPVFRRHYLLSHTWSRISEGIFDFFYLQIINGRYTLWKPLHMKKVLEAIFGLLLIVGIMQLLSHFARCAVE